MGANALRTVRTVIVPLVLLAVVGALGLRSAPEAHGLSFNPHLGASLADSSPGVASDINLDFSIDAPDPIFDSIVTFLPSEMYIAPDADVPNGAIAGTLDAESTLGLFNGDCNTLLPVHFDLVEASTDIHDLIPLYSGYPDFNNNGLPENVDHYPEFLVRLAPNLQPIERLYGQTLVAGVQTFVNFVVFAPGTKIARLPEMDASLGYQVVVFLNDPTSPSVPFAITDFCTPLSTNTVVFGTSQDNPDTTANESSVTLKRNPQSAGGYNAVSFVRSQWDTDGDGVENTMDPCPFTLDPGWDPRGGGSQAADADSDGLPNSCDPSPNDTNSDQDGDGYQNKQDNCPLFAENYPPDYDHDGIGDACDPLPEDASQGGVAQRAEVCLTSEFEVGAGGTAPEVVCPSGPDVILPPVLMIDPGGEKFRVGTVLSLYAQLTEPISNEPIAATKISFDVTGANPTTGNCTTNNFGNCQFNYAAPNVGTDTITASADVGAEHITNTATVEWLNPPENDDFANATVIGALPYEGDSTLAASGHESGESRACGADQQSVWFEFTPQSDVFVKIEAHGGSGDYPDLGLFSGTTVATATPVTCGYTVYPPPPFESAPAKTPDPLEAYLFASLDAGTKYHIQAGGFGSRGAIEDLAIELSEAVLGDTNCDGLRDGLDILGMLRSSVGFGQPECSGAADFDCSGYLNPEDIVSELRLQAGVWSPGPCNFSLS